MTVESITLQQLEAQMLALPVADRLHLIQAIARSLQTEIVPAPDTEESVENGSNSDVIALDPEDAKNLDEHGNRHPLLVMLESLEPLDDEEEFPDVDEGLLPLDDVCL